MSLLAGELRESMAIRNAAFTLIELLVVIAIIAVLAALLFPVFTAAKRSSQRTSTLSNEQQLNMGLQLYIGDNDDTYPWAINSMDVIGGRSWGTGAGDVPTWAELLIPYVRSLEVYQHSGAAPASDQYWMAGRDEDAVRNGGLRTFAANSALMPSYPRDYTNFNGYNAAIRNGSSLPRPSTTIALMEGYPTGVVLRVGHDGLKVGNKTGRLSVYWSNAIANEWFACNAIEGTTNFDARALIIWNGGSNYALADGHAKWMRPETTTARYSVVKEEGDFWQWYHAPGAPENLNNPPNTDNPDAYSAICPS